MHIVRYEKKNTDSLNFVSIERSFLEASMHAQTLHF